LKVLTKNHCKYITLGKITNKNKRAYFNSTVFFYNLQRPIRQYENYVTPSCEFEGLKAPSSAI
jgi:hypothetical protein